MLEDIGQDPHGREIRDHEERIAVRLHELPRRDAPLDHGSTKGRADRDTGVEPFAPFLTGSPTFTFRLRTCPLAGASTRAIRSSLNWTFPVVVSSIGRSWLRTSSVLMLASILSSSVKVFVELTGSDSRPAFDCPTD